MEIKKSATNIQLSSASAYNIKEPNINNNNNYLNPNPTTNVESYYNLLNSGEIQLKVLLTWRDYAIGLRRKRKKINDLLNKTNKMKTDKLNNSISNNNNNNNISINPVNNIPIINRDGPDTESEEENNENNNQMNDNDNKRKSKPNTLGVNNFKLSVVVSTSNSIITTHATNYVTLHKECLEIAGKKTKIPQSSLEIQRQMISRKSTNRKRRLAVPNLNDLNAEYRPSWQPHCLKILRRLVCTPVAIIMFFCILGVDCSTNWIYLDDNQEVFAGLLRICNFTFDNDTEIFNFTINANNSEITKKDCYFGFIFIEGQEILLGMRVLALAFQLTSIVLQFYSIYNISSPRNIKRYYFHSAGECLAATAIICTIDLLVFKWMANNQFKYFSLGVCYYIYAITIVFNIACCITLVMDDFVHDFQTLFFPKPTDNKL